MAWAIALTTMLSMTLLNSLHAARHNATTSKAFVCYFTATSYFPASQVPADLCTHLIYAFGTITQQGIKPTKSSDVQNYKTLVQLKKRNPDLKVLLSLQQGFDTVVHAGPEVMKSFSQTSVSFLQAFGFDGVDLDWEFPKAVDKDNFIQFIEIFKDALNKYELIMSAALPNSPAWFQGFDTNTLAKNMDFMTAMTYDFHLFIKGVDNTTGYNSPLFTPPGENKFLSTSEMLNYYINQGMPLNKLLMGIPIYGRSWTLADMKQHSLHSPAVGKGEPGPFRGFRGIYLYPDVCMAQQNGAKTVTDDTNGAAYLYANKTWVAYEDEQTAIQKISWMKSQNLGGVGIWALNLDDNVGVCNSGSLPLLNAIKSNL